MITRKDYLAACVGNTTDAERMSLHRGYYAQFVTPGVVRAVVAHIGADRIKASVDPHMNDIPLSRWDMLHGTIREMAASRCREVGEGNSLATSVCIAKEAARQYRESGQ
jgi:hypothetical protein